MRKHKPRKVWTPLPPKGLRPKLDGEQMRDLALAHLVNLDDIASGSATSDVMWQWAESVLIWQRVAQTIGQGEPEMDAQAEIAKSVIERFKRTGKVGFSGPEYQEAKRGVEVMDALAAVVDRPTAVAACAWSERHMPKAHGWGMEA